MNHTNLTFKAAIIASSRILFEGEPWSVFLPGSTGEFEVLAFHKPIISRLKEGRIVVNWDLVIPIKDGAVMVSDAGLTAIVKE